MTAVAAEDTMEHSDHQQGTGSDAPRECELGVALRNLVGADGVVRLCPPKGQVLVHAGHMAPGIFILTTGAISLRKSKTTLDRWEASDLPLAFPRQEELESRSEFDVHVGAHSVVWYIPKTLLAFSQAARETLAFSALDWHSLRLLRSGATSTDEGQDQPAVSRAS